MLSRLLEGLAGFVDDDDYTTASEGGSPPQDGGHLTSAAMSRRGSARGDAAASGSPTQQQQQQQRQPQRQRRRTTGEDGEEEDVEQEEEEEEEGEAAGGGRGGSGSGGWHLLDGVPFLPAIVQLLSPRAVTTSDTEAAARMQPFGSTLDLQQEAAAAPAPLSPGGSTRFPTLLAEPGTEAAAGGASAEGDELAGTTTPPAPLEPGQQPLPQLSEPSTLMAEEHIRALAAAVPARYRHARWALLYSTARDGISLQTMLRKAHARAPTVLVVRDFAKHVFGAYCSEPWKLDKHYFGTGETFVFQLVPCPNVWYWWWKRMQKEPNDYFQWATSEAIAVGGAGGYALWLDADLAAGISRNSTTFGNSCLAASEEFKVGAVELWGLS